MHESGENYLETILLLKHKNGLVRSIDIAREMGFSKPSVSRAVGLLKDSAYITISNEGEIELTQIGKEKAEQIYERHKVLTQFFVEVAKVSMEIAEEDACRIEHVISDETFQGMKQFLKKKE